MTIVDWSLCKLIWATQWLPYTSTYKPSICAPLDVTVSGTPPSRLSPILSARSLVINDWPPQRPFFYTCINYHRVQCRSKAVSGSRLRSYIDNTWNMMWFYTLVSPSTKTRMSFFRQAVKVTSNIKLYRVGGGGGGGEKKRQERKTKKYFNILLSWFTLQQNLRHYTSTAWPLTND